MILWKKCLSGICCSLSSQSGLFSCLQDLVKKEEESTVVFLISQKRGMVKTTVMCIFMTSIMVMGGGGIHLVYSGQKSEGCL
jgi:hypothetical protein